MNLSDKLINQSLFIPNCKYWNNVFSFHTIGLRLIYVVGRNEYVTWLKNNTWSLICLHVYVLPILARQSNLFHKKNRSVCKLWNPILDVTELGIIIWALKLWGIINIRRKWCCLFYDPLLNMWCTYCYVGNCK